MSVYQESSQEMMPSSIRGGWSNDQPIKIEQNGISSISNDASRDRHLLLVMNIDIDDSNKDTIHVYDDSHPEDLAKEFCQRYQLDQEAHAIVTEQIISNLEALLEKQSSPIRGGVPAYVSRGGSAPSLYSKPVPMMQPSGRMVSGHNSSIGDSANLGVHQVSSPIFEYHVPPQPDPAKLREIQNVQEMLERQLEEGEPIIQELTNENDTSGDAEELRMEKPAIALIDNDVSQSRPSRQFVHPNMSQQHIGADRQFGNVLSPKNYMRPIHNFLSPPPPPPRDEAEGLSFQPEINEM
jgi:hypothetical protein